MGKMGKQADVARELGISRQAVSRLVKRRDINGMPTPNETGLYELAQVRDWYLSFDPRRGPKRGIKAEQ